MVITSIECPTCSRHMGIRTATTGVFLGCSGYALPPKERCKQTINLIPEDELLNILEGKMQKLTRYVHVAVARNVVLQWTVT